jgi:hypothetical protein
MVRCFWFLGRCSYYTLFYLPIAEPTQMIPNGYSRFTHIFGQPCCWNVHPVCRTCTVVLPWC